MNAWHVPRLFARTSWADAFVAPDKIRDSLLKEQYLVGSYNLMNASLKDRTPLIPLNAEKDATLFSSMQQAYHWPRWVT